MLHLAEGNEVACCQTGLPTGRNEDDDGFAITKFLYVVECGLVHCGHTRTIMLLTEPFEVYLNRHWPDCRSEIEKPKLASPEPFSNIGSIGHGSGKPNHPDLILFIHSGNDDFDDGSSLLP